MRLTKDMREAFVRNVMNDVPKIDYDEEYRKIALEAAIDAMPEAVRAAYKAHPEWINTRWGRLVEGGLWMDLPGAANTELEDTISKSFAKKLSSNAALKEKQDEAHKALEQKLSSVARASTTTQMLLKLVPEFEKYIPLEAVATTNLPAVQNVVADFVKAGWPKGGSA